MNKFSDVLEMADAMSQEERENLIQILQARLRDERRAQSAQDVREAEKELRAGRCVPATPAEIMKQILR
jgi:hypothetical protein